MLQSRVFVERVWLGVNNRSNQLIFSSDGRGGAVVAVMKKV